MGHKCKLTVYCGSLLCGVSLSANRMAVNELKSWPGDRWCCSGAQAGGDTSSVDIENHSDRQRKSKLWCSPSILMENRMINLLIIVLRAVAALTNALIAILELIRQFID